MTHNNPVEELVVVYLRRQVPQQGSDPRAPVQLLLGKHSPGKAFGGILNGIGGKSNPGENLEAAAWRELNEEISGIRSTQASLKHFAVTENHYRIDANNPAAGHVLRVRVHFFWLDHWTGEPKIRWEENGKPFSELLWHNINDLPFRDMMADQAWWLSTAINLEDEMSRNGQGMHVTLWFADTSPKVSKNIEGVKCDARKLD